jgi:hypothetical protein
MTKLCWGSRHKVMPWVLFITFTALPLSCGSSPADAPAPTGRTWLARIGNQSVDAQEFQAYLEQQTRRNPCLQITPAIKRDLLEKCLEKKLLLAEADCQGLDRDPEVIKELKEMKEQVLIKHLFAHKEKELTEQTKIDDEVIQKYYKDMGQVLQFRYVSVADPSQAKAILDDWTQKGPPTELVDSGEVSLATLNENWKRQIINLPLHKPQTAKINSQWFVVEVVKKREEAVLPLNQVREHIVWELTDRNERELLQNWVDSLKGQNRLEINAAHNWR